MNHNKIILFLIIVIVLAGAGYFYLNKTSSLQKIDNQIGTPKSIELDKSIFENLETDVITVVFADDTTGPQAKEILISLGLNDSTLDYILESSNYEGWLTSGRIHVQDSMATARAIAEKAKTFDKVYSAEANEIHYSTQSLYPEREKFFADIEFIDGIGQNEAENELNKISQSRLSILPNNPTIQNVVSRTEIFEPRKDINVTIKNLTSKKAFSACQQLLAIEKIISCTPLPLLN